MFKKLWSGVQEKYKKMQEEDELYYQLLGKVTLLPKFYPFTVVDKKNLTISHKQLQELCPDLNENDAIMIRGLIPIDEVCLECFYASECRSGIKFYFVATTSFLWLINTTDKTYLKYQYQGIAVAPVKSGLMSQVILLGNMLFTVNGLKDAVLQFEKLFLDANYRSEVIRNKLAMFCDTHPKELYLNSIGSGISIGDHNEIVFHAKDLHYKYAIQDIKNYELLLDDMVVREKKNNRRSRITANKSSCYQMVLRVTTSDQIFLIPILERTVFNNLYSSTNVIFRDCRAFGDQLINVLDDLDDKLLNGEL